MRYACSTANIFLWNFEKRKRPEPISNTFPTHIAAIARCFVWILASCMQHCGSPNKWWTAPRPNRWKYWCYATTDKHCKKPCQEKKGARLEACCKKVLVSQKCVSKQRLCKFLCTKWRSRNNNKSDCGATYSLQSSWLTFWEQTLLMFLLFYSQKKQDEAHEPECRHVCWRTEKIPIYHIFQRTHLWDTLTWHTEVTLLQDTLLTWHSYLTLF